MSNKSVCRTAPATPGLLNIQTQAQKCLNKFGPSDWQFQLLPSDWHYQSLSLDWQYELLLSDLQYQSLLSDWQYHSLPSDSQYHWLPSYWHYQLLLSDWQYQLLLSELHYELIHKVGSISCFHTVRYHLYRWYAFSESAPSLSDWTDLNEVGTALRTSRLTNLSHLPDPECPKYGPNWAKKWSK